MLGHESDKMARQYAGEARKFAAANLITNYSLAQSSELEIRLFQTYRLRRDTRAAPSGFPGTAPSEET